MIDEKTFGTTPAAKYLIRELSRPGNETRTKSVTRKLVSTNTSINDLLSAYHAGALKSKTFANCLRLMREDISRNIQVDIIDQLCQNVQIGFIKRCIRLTTVNRKAERVMISPQNRASKMRSNVYGDEYFFVDSTSNKEYHAGTFYHPIYESSKPEVVVARYSQIEDVTPDVLMERSNRRCARLGKPHMENVGLSKLYWDSL